MKEFNRQQVEDQLQALAMGIKFGSDINLTLRPGERVVRLISGAQRVDWTFCIEPEDEMLRARNVATVFLFSYDLLKLEVYDTSYTSDDDFIKTFMTFQEFRDYIPELYKVLVERDWE